MDWGSDPHDIVREIARGIIYIYWLWHTDFHAAGSGRGQDWTQKLQIINTDSKYLGRILNKPSKEQLLQWRWSPEWASQLQTASWPTDQGY